MAGAPNDPPLLELRDVQFSYGAAPVLQNVNLAITSREPLSIVGPNGGGKTTLLRLLLGLLKPQRGTVRVLGEPPQRSRRRIGYMPQHLQYDAQFPISVLEVVLMGRLGARKGFFYNARDREIASRVLAEVDLGGLEKRPFSALSGGQRQRVLIARALACEPDLLLLDEPTANVDAAIEERLLRTLQELHERMAIIIVSHDLGFVSQLVKEVICVNKRVFLHKTAELTGEIMQSLYGADIQAVEHNHGHGHGHHHHH
jgi:zinc transport system ATP-binding protein